MSSNRKVARLADQEASLEHDLAVGELFGLSDEVVAHLETLVYGYYISGSIRYCARRHCRTVAGPLALRLQLEPDLVCVNCQKPLGTAPREGLLEPRGRR